MKRKNYVRLSLGDDIFKRLRLPLKIRLFLPISFIIILVVVIATIWFVSTSIKTINEQIESNLELEVKTISKMFERESMLKLKNVQTNLKVASHHFYSHKLSIQNRTIDIEVENQKMGSGTLQRSMFGGTITTIYMGAITLLIALVVCLEERYRYSRKLIAAT